jgi:hypothetical protein
MNMYVCPQESLDGFRTYNLQLSVIPTWPTNELEVGGPLATLRTGGLQGRAMAQAVIPPVSHHGSRCSRLYQAMWVLWWTKWHWHRLSPSSSVLPAYTILPWLSIPIGPIGETRKMGTLRNCVHYIVTCVRFPWLNNVSTATTMG